MTTGEKIAQKFEEIGDRLWEAAQSLAEQEAFEAGRYPGVVCWREEDMVSALDISGDGPARVTQVKMGLFKNGDLLAWAEPTSEPGYCAYRGMEGFSFAKLPDMELSLEPAKDLLQAVWFFRDNYGRILVESETYQLGVNGRLIHLHSASAHSAPEEWNCPRDNHGWPK